MKWQRWLWPGVVAVVIALLVPAGDGVAGKGSGSTPP